MSGEASGLFFPSQRFVLEGDVAGAAQDPADPPCLVPDWGEDGLPVYDARGHVQGLIIPDGLAGFHA